MRAQSRNAINDMGAQLLANNVRLFENLRSLDLSRNNLSDSGGAHPASSAPAWPPSLLFALGADELPWPRAGLITLCNSLTFSQSQSCALQEFRVAYNAFRGKGWRVLSELIAASNDLAVLGERWRGLALQRDAAPTRLAATA